MDEGLPGSCPFLLSASGAPGGELRLRLHRGVLSHIAQGDFRNKPGLAARPPAAANSNTFGFLSAVQNIPLIPSMIETLKLRLGEMVH